MTTAAQRERAALVETMREVGPDAPTLCGDWTTRDLAAHLVVRERRLDATPGIMVPALAGYTDRVQRQTAQGSEWEALLDKVASGPPLYSPFKLLDPVANMGEMYIHHEDVRRAQSGWEPRPLDDATVTALTRSLPLMARMTLAKAPARMTLKTPQGKSLAPVGKGEPLTVIGEAQELLLFVSGRDEVRVEFEGDAAVVDAVRKNRRGL
ncbi:TIGR03085 family metal-binding protein [Mycobacterium sp. 852002-51961_SCH5331710]|uniref:TIGR03085 family metal-binding protein n=1 Tax=Mycobacterium sp. 852002-51961_SCH5331710 TaxID=1834105 RepID=UPI0007FCB863|nr:TIGR03085 family metal-binding protein [Mycobacterium sp. 852002-51961_SCH5331710]OBB35416.1 TIGR03085 family protein [Mycobacterium sp. 852002-51961_SCH5331710]